MKKHLLFLTVLSTISLHASSQILKFYHILQQDDIQDANFTLHQKEAQQIHPIVPLTVVNQSHVLTQGIWDYIKTMQAVRVVSANEIRVKTTSGKLRTVSVAAGMEYNGVPGSEFIIPPNTPIIMPAGDVYVTSMQSNVEIRLAPVMPATSFLAGNAIQPLMTRMVRLVAPTKGTVSVSGGKIFFDPWQIKNFTTPAGGLIDINENTTIPLELLDDRTRIGDPTKVLRVPYRHYTFSVNSIPFRYRGRRVIADTVHSTGTVTTAFSLALSVGRTWGYSSITTRARNDYSFTLGAFLGPSSVDLKKENVKHPAEFKSGRTNPVLSYGINSIFARNGFGILMAVGFDNAFGKYGNDWIYDKKIWMGLGLSASFPK